MKLPTDTCLICHEPLAKDYTCSSDRCHREFHLEIMDEGMADFYLGPKDKGYIVQYMFNDDGSFQCAKVFARPYSKHVCDFPEPFDFQKYTASQIIQRIEKLKLFS